MFTIEMIPATAGDCLLVRYGPDDAPHAVLVDGGRAKTYKAHLKEGLADRLGPEPALDLLVVTHIDGDHIYGAVSLLRDKRSPVAIHEVWFNGFRHLGAGPKDKLGPRQGDDLTKAIEARDLPWNTLWDGNAVAIPSPRALPTVTLGGGLRLTLLSPTLAGLAKLRPGWAKYLEEAKHAAEATDGPEDKLGPRRIDPDPDPRTLAKAPFEEDTSLPNGSSIAMLAEYEGKRLLLAGDAYPSVLAAALQSYGQAVGEERPRIDLAKLSHHGGKGNTSPDLLEAMDCSRFLFSTDGSIFQHPHDETVSRVIMRGGKPTLYFNHRTAITRRWGDASRKRTFGYAAVFPKKAGESLEVEV